MPTKKKKPARKQIHPGWKLAHTVVILVFIAVVLWFNQGHGHGGVASLDKTDLKSVGEVAIGPIIVELVRRLGIIG